MNPGVTDSLCLSVKCCSGESFSNRDSKMLNDILSCSTHACEQTRPCQHTQIDIVTQTHRQTHTHTHQNQHKLSECTITLTYTKHIYTYHTMHKTQQKHKPETVYNTTPRTQKHTLHLFLTILVTNNLWRTLEVAFHFQSFDFEEVELERTRESEFIR